MTDNPIKAYSSSSNSVTTDFNAFDQYLEGLGLPKENILAPVSERAVIQTNFPDFVAALPEQVRRDSRYLSKFVAASSIGLFDAALNYVWNEVVLNLRKKAVIYGLDLFFDAAVGGKVRDLYETEADLSGIKDKVLLDTCSKLELISQVIYNKLTHILIMRNDIGASHPNHASINAYELMGWLQTCVQEVIHDTPSEAAIQIKALIDNLKTLPTNIDPNTLAQMQARIRELHTKNTDNVLQTIFGLYASSSSNNILKKNISLLAPVVWQHASDDLKYKLGITLDGYRANLHNDKYEAGNEFFEFCDGNQYKTLEARVITIDALLDDLLAAHNAWDNFYNEVPHARQIMSHIKNENDIPTERKEKLIRVFLICRVGNGYDYCQGVSPAGKRIYDQLFEMLGDDNISFVITGMYHRSIHTMLSNNHGRKHGYEILKMLRKNAVSHKLQQILDYLIGTGPKLENTMNETAFKQLASSHINFG